MQTLEMNGHASRMTLFMDASWSTPKTMPELEPKVYKEMKMTGRTRDMASQCLGMCPDLYRYVRRHDDSKDAQGRLPFQYTSIHMPYASTLIQSLQCPQVTTIWVIGLFSVNYIQATL